ncbi:MAG TPA: DUF5666 domain-containing protein [Acidimicrobiales bacterium]
MSNHPFPRRARRVAGAAGLTVGLAAGGYGVASAASGTTTTTPPAGASASGGGSTSGTGAPGAAALPSGRPGRSGFPGGAGRKAFGRGGGTITAIAANAITVAGPGGEKHQVLTDSSTTYHRDGQAAQRSDLAVGERVAVRPVRPATPPAAGTLPASSPITAADVDIISPSMQGTVDTVSGSTITITDGQGFQRTIHTSGGTTYDLGGQPASAGDVKAGERVFALGTVDADKTDLDATKISVILPRAAGIVQSVAGGTITLTEPGGATQKVTTTPSTVYRSNGATASASDVKVGDFLVATGQKQADGSIVATTVTFGSKPQPPGGPGPGGGWGPGGPGRFGPRGAGPDGPPDATPGAPPGTATA